MSHFPISTRMRQLAPLALVLISATVVVGAYMQVLWAPFIADDFFYIVNNTKLTRLGLAELWFLFLEPYNPFEFLPLRDFSYWLDIVLFGQNPAAFRVHNIVLYLFCLPLIYAVTLELWRYFRSEDIKSAPWVAAVVTALFAVHSAHVEAVVWISGRKDVLSGMFSMLSLWFAVNARRGKSFSVSYAIATLIALLAAMLSKATAVAVAPIIAMLWIIFWSDTPVSSRRHIQLLWPFAILLVAISVAVIFAANSTVRVPAYIGTEVVSRALAVLGWLVRLSVSPEGRYYFYPVLDSQLLIMVALGAGCLVGAVTGLWVMMRRKSLGWFAAVSFVLLCVPYMQLIPFQTHSLVGDRFLFLAVWPAMLLVVALAWRLDTLPRIVLLVFIALLVCFQTIERPREWRSSEGMDEHELKGHPGHYLPALFVIKVKLARGQNLAAAEIAKNIIDADARDILTRLIVCDFIVRVKSSSSPDEAIAHLQELGIALKNKSIQERSRYDPTMSLFWRTTKYMYGIQWSFLAEHFPDDMLVRYNAKLWLENT